MTASIVEIITGTIPNPSAGTNFAVTTTLVSSDVVAVVWGMVSAEAGAVSGLGGTWTEAFNMDQTGSGRVKVVYTTGVTGTGNVTIPNGNASFTGAAAVYVIRGLNSFAVTEQHSVWDANSTPGNTDEFTPSQSFGEDQVALAAGTVSAGTVTFPSNPTPASGWTTDVAKTTTVRVWSAHLVGTALHSTLQVGLRSSSTRAIGVVAVVFGTPTAGAPPLTSTFVGWGNPIF